MKKIIWLLGGMLVALASGPVLADQGIVPAINPISAPPDKEKVVDEALFLTLQQRYARAMQVFAGVQEPFLRQRIGGLVDYYRDALGQSDTRRMADLLRQIEQALHIKPPPKIKLGKDSEASFYGRRPGFSFGMVNTNYDEGKGEVAGGMDADLRLGPEDTNAGNDIYPNKITDRVLIRREHPAWNRLAKAFNQILGHGGALNPVIPLPGFEAGLITQADTINIIANQVFSRATGPDQPPRKIAVTWMLPPGWAADQSHAVMMIFPPMGISNNAALFEDPALKIFVVLMEALKASHSKHLALMIVNSGGLTASGMQPDFEYPLMAALEYGVARLGIDPRRMMMLGDGRGGYAAMSMAGRLKAIAPPEMPLAWRGIFVGEAGTISQEMAASVMLAPFDLFHRIGETPDVTTRRLIGYNKMADLVEKGPLGSLSSLKPTAPMVFYWAGNIWNPALLPSSWAALMPVIQALPNTQSQIVLDIGDKLDGFADQRYRLAVACLADLSDNRDCQLPQTGLTIPDYHGDQMPVMLRSPAWVLVNQAASLEIIGPPGAVVTVGMTAVTGLRRVLPPQIMPPQSVLTLAIPPNSSDGKMTLDVSVNQLKIGDIKIPVVSHLPDPSILGFNTEKWIPPIMPHLPGNP